MNLKTLKTRKPLKSGHSYYDLIERFILKQYHVTPKTKLLRSVELHDDGWSKHYKISPESLLEQDIEVVSLILKENRDMPQPSVYLLFNPSKAKKEFMQTRCRVAYEAIVRRDINDI